VFLSSGVLKIFAGGETHEKTHEDFDDATRELVVAGGETHEKTHEAVDGASRELVVARGETHEKNVDICDMYYRKKDLKRNNEYSYVFVTLFSCKLKERSKKK